MTSIPPAAVVFRGRPNVVGANSGRWREAGRAILLLWLALQGAASPPSRANQGANVHAEDNRSWAVSSGPSPKIRFEPLTRADGIPLDRVYQMLHDRRGFIWFTTTEGLVRYDGYQHIRYPGMPLVSIAETANQVPGFLFEDRDGALWIAADVLTRFDPNLGQFTGILRPRSGATRPGIDRITAVQDGRKDCLWVGVSSYDQSVEISEPVLYEVNTASGASTAHRIPSDITAGRPASSP